MKLLLMLAVLMAWATPAIAGPCVVREKLLDYLYNTWSEERSIVALHSTGALVEIFVSPSGTWTLTVYGPGGMCVVGSGTRYDPDPPPLDVPTEPKPEEQLGDPT